MGTTNTKDNTVESINLVQFCAIVLCSLTRPCYNAGRRCRQRQGYERIDENFDDFIDQRIEDPEPEPLIVLVRDNATATY